MIHDETKCALGEGPLWHPERHELFWFDILGKRLHCKSMNGAKHHWQFSRHSSAAGWIDKRHLLVADSIGLHKFDIETGTADQLAELEPDSLDTRSNDGRADPWGGFWIGTMGFAGETGAGAIYRYYRGEVRTLYSAVTIPNAICFPPDGSCAYFTDTAKGQIMRQPLSDKHGWPKGDPDLWLDLSGQSFGPDGAVIDASGHMLNAHWGAGRVARYDPQGALTETFAFPALQTTCPAFGGPELSTLFCTSASTDLDGADDGKTFATQTQITGQAEHQVIL